MKEKGINQISSVKRNFHWQFYLSFMIWSIVISGLQFTIWKKNNMLFTCKVFKFFSTFLAAIFFRGMTHIRTDLYLLYIVISFKPNPHFFQTSFSITVRITLHLLSKVYQYTIRNNHLPVTNPIIVELNTFIYVVYNSIGETIKGFVTTLHIQQLP